MTNAEAATAVVGQFVRHLKTGQRGRVLRVENADVGVVEVLCTDKSRALMNVSNLQIIPMRPAGED